MAQELPLALPRYVMLKNRFNNKYMRFTNEDTQQHGFLRLTEEEAVPVSPYAKFEVEPSKTGQGLVHLRCAYNNKYWVRTSETQKWLAAAADAPEEDQSDWICTLFKPVPADPKQQNLFRFLHVQLDKYASLSRLGPPFSNLVYAGSSQTPDDPTDTRDVFEVLDWIEEEKKARTEVKEVAVSRRIFDVTFRVMDARIYDQSIVTVATEDIENNSPEARAAKVDLLAGTDASKIMSTWASNVSVKLGGVPTTMKSCVPTVGEGQIVDVYRGEVSGEYAWGERLEQPSREVVPEYEVTVGPYCRARVSLSATRATCDVPFSYTQRDTLADGTQVSYRLDDGIYTGVNYYNFEYESKEEKLTEEEVEKLKLVNEEPEEEEGDGDR